jgi:membrane protease YdiL (CAAX protease family)
VACAGAAGAVLTRLMTGTFPDTVAHVTIESMLANDSGIALWAMSALVVLGAPILEELTYRGFVQEALRRAGVRPWPAVVVTSLLFAVMHMSAVPAHGLFALFVLSLGIGWAFERTGRLTASIVMHAAFNLGNLTLALTTG